MNGYIIEMSAFARDSCDLRQELARNPFENALPL
jgi:hypothetical protein